MTDQDKFNGTLDRIIAHYPQDQTSLIMVLQDVNKEFRYLPEAALKTIAQRLDVPLSKIYAVATFYKIFSLKPRGETHVRVCMGTACHIKGAPIILENIEHELGIKCGQTSQDLKYSIETVNCVGACSLAPLVVLNQKYYGNIKPTKIKSLFKGKKTDEN
ncbi:NAD(P)H-dependent oxidoreductase subunit E [bacterium]|nr:NAD(P)H-dependent oxidoreductase subunit E [bacterium]